MSEPGDRLLLDTHALLWSMAGTLDGKVVEAIAKAVQANGLLVSPVSAWELGMLSRPLSGSPRVRLAPSPERWFNQVLAKPGLTDAPLSVAIALAASALPEFHRDPADRLLVATARALNVPIVTRDRKILDYAEAGHVKAVAC